MILIYRYYFYYHYSHDGAHLNFSWHVFGENKEVIHVDDHFDANFYSDLDLDSDLDLNADLDLHL